MPNQPVSGNTHNYTRSRLPHIAITLCLQAINTEKKNWIIKKRESEYRDKNVFLNVGPLVDSHGNGRVIFPEITL